MRDDDRSNAHDAASDGLGDRTTSSAPRAPDALGELGLPPLRRRATPSPAGVVAAPRDPDAAAWPRRCPGRPVGRGRLVVVDELLVSLLPRPGADDLHGHVAARHPPRQPDQLVGELEDVHRLAHLEREHLAAVRERGRLQHELHGLLHAHEVAGHLGVGHRHRSARGDLAEERRARPSRGCRARCRTGRRTGWSAAGEPADDVLRHPLRATHHARRPNGLVGRDQDEALGARRAAAASTTFVVPRTFVRSASCGCSSRIGTCLWAAAWKTTCGSVLAEHLEHALPIADVRQDGRGPRRRRASPAGRAGGSRRCRGARGSSGSKVADLPRDLGADRPARAR